MDFFTFLYDQAYSYQIQAPRTKRSPCYWPPLAPKPSLGKRAGFLESLALPRRIFCIFPLFFIKRLRGTASRSALCELAGMSLVTLLPSTLPPSHPLIPLMTANRIKGLEFLSIETSMWPMLPCRAKRQLAEVVEYLDDQRSCHPTPNF